MRTCVLLCVLLVSAIAPAAAQVYGVLSPSSRTAAQSGSSVTLSGWVLASGQAVNIEIVDQNTGELTPLTTVNASTSGSTYHAVRCLFGNHPPCTTVTYTLYPWSYSSAGALATHYWAPQLAFAAGLPASQGHLELVASAGGVTLPTFSAEALSLMKQSTLYHTDPEAASKRYSDGTSTVLFDQYGVGGAAPTWTTVAGMMAKPPPPPNNTNYPDVAWSIGSYTVGPSSHPLTIYALICAPNHNGVYPMVVYNHGGINYGTGNPDIGSLHGHVTSDKWTAAPAVSTDNDDLGQCVDWAKRGWIFAMSSYRAESIAIASDDPTVFPTKTWTSSSSKANGASEFCMGEVTDVMALVDTLVNHIGNITIGDPNNAASQIHVTTTYDDSNPSISWGGQLFMYGYSHGGCVTYRAVEQGAPVNAFAVVEGFTDQSLTYLAGYAACEANPSSCTVGGTFAPGAFAAAGAGAVDNTGVMPYFPDATGVMGYNWRSAHYFAARGDLGIRKFSTMPILILHGDINAGNPVPLDQPAELAGDINAADIFYGPSSDPPPNQSCIAPPAGAPIVDPTTHAPLSGVPSSCMVPFQIMDTGDPCLTASPLTFAPVQCQVILLPQAPWQQHYLVVYHNMDHVNGGLGIKVQFDRFAEQNFRRKPGCDGVPVAKTTPPYSQPIACNGFF